MGRTPKYYKHDTCECNDDCGCELCTCADCGEWLKCSEHSVCDLCLDKFEQGEK